MRRAAIRAAEKVTQTLQAHADMERIPYMAVCIDHRRLATMMGFDAERFRDKQRVARGILYAERLGLIAVLCRGRPRPGRGPEDADKGIPGLYAIFHVEADNEARTISTAEMEALRLRALSDIKIRKRTRERVNAYFARVDRYDRGRDR